MTFRYPLRSISFCELTREMPRYATSYVRISADRIETTSVGNDDVYANLNPRAYIHRGGFTSRSGIVRSFPRHAVLSFIANAMTLPVRQRRSLRMRL